MVSQCQPIGTSRLPLLAIGIVSIGWMSCWAPADAQLIPGLQDDQKADPAPKDDLQRLNSDRRTAQQFQQLQSALRTGDNAEFRESLDALRAADPAMMLPQASGVFQPLHRGLTVALLGASDELRRSLAGDEESATRELNRAIADGSPSDILNVLHRHSGTEASLRAHVLLAMIHLDRGYSQAALYWLAPVLQAKQIPELQTTATKLRDRITGDAVSDDPAQSNGDEPATSRNESNDSNTRISDEPEDSAKAEESATAGTKDGKSLKADYQFLHWMQSLPLSVRQKRVSQDFVLNASQAPMVPWTAWRPEIDADSIFVRLPDMVSAFERSTGRHLWTRVLRQRRANVNEPSGMDDMLPLMLPGMQSNQQAESSDVSLLHRNEIIGRMSSDRQRLYVISQVSDANRGRDVVLQNRLLFGREENSTAGLWELVAIEKSTGRRVWTAGGAPVEKRFGNELSQTWFCGTPHVDGELLYSIVERDSAIKLVCMNAATGQVQWQIPLMFPDAAIAQDLGRQLLAAQTSSHQGVVFTTTTTGWFMAVDKLTRSVLWASRLPGNSGAPANPGRLRSSALNVQQMKPLESTWHSEAPFFAGKWVYCVTAESPSLSAFDMLTGKLEVRKNIEKSTLLLHADQDMLVFAGGRTLFACRPGTLRELWTTERSGDLAVNVGQGIRNGDELAIPLTDGSIEFRSVKTGALIARRTGLRPSRSSGGLYAAGDDLVSFGPDHVAVISTKAPEKSPAQDALQRATFLMDTGRVDEASQLLSAVTANSINRDDVRRLRFRIAAARAAAENADDATISAVAELAGSAEERAISAFLRLMRLKTAAAPDEYARALCQELSDPNGSQSVEMPDADKVIEALRSVSVVNPLEISALAKGRETIRRPFRSWLASELMALLEASTEETRPALIELLRALPRNELLSMHSSWLSDVFLELAEKDVQEGTVTEQTLQLLLASFEKRATPDLAGRDKLAQRLDQLASEIAAKLRTVRIAGESAASAAPADSAEAGSQAPRVENEMPAALVEVIRDEILKQLGAGVEIPDTVASPIAELSRAMEGQSYRMLPVSTAGQMNFRPMNRQALECEPMDDPFLSAFHWFVRREPGALMARSSQNPDSDPWVFPMASTESQMLQAHESLVRCGSVILYRGGAAISGFSVIDNRWLWTRPATGASSVLVLEPVFRQFNPDMHSSNLFDPARRICGLGSRWVCLQTASTLEVFDVYSGRSMWQMNAVGLQGFAYAGTEGVLIADRSGRDDLLLQTETGIPIRMDAKSGQTSKSASEKPTEEKAEKDGKSSKPEKSELSLPASVRRASMARRIVRAAGSDLVVWNARGMFVAGASLEWVNMKTLDVSRTIALPDESYSQFLSYNKLAVASEDHKLLLIDLSTGRSSEYDFNTVDEDLPDLQGPEIRVMADRDYAYVFGSTRMAAIGLPSSVYGLKMVPVARQLRVIDRETGTLAWAREVNSNTFLCDDGGQSPVLLIVQMEGDEAGANAIPAFGLRMGQSYRVFGLLKSSGKEVFNYPVVSQTPFPQMRLTVSSLEQLELDALGNRVRFVAGNAEPK